MAALGVAALHAEPALAQARAGSQDVQIYGGNTFGGNIMETPLSGSIPQLDDSPTVGGRYTYYLTDRWGLQLSAGYSPNRAIHVAGGDRDLGIKTVDLDALWNIGPGFRLVNHELFPYTVVGVGYAWAHLNHPLSGFIGASPATIEGSDGYTANAGIGVKSYLQKGFFVDFGARYRYLSRVVSRHGQGVNTGEVALGLGYEF